MDISRIIVTGVNRGLGYDLLHLILKNKQQCHVIGTVRAQSKQLEDKLHQQYPANKLTIMELDLVQKQSIQKFTNQLIHQKIEFDCLINNGAFGCDYGTQVPSLEIAVQTLTPNFIGTVDLTNRLLPLLKPHGRIINVSSKLGALNFHGKQIIEKYSNQAITLEQIQKEVFAYIEGCKEGNVGNYYKSAYGTSKMMLNAWARFILKKKLKNGQVVISMSPGHCKTDMGRQHALRTSLQGAQSIYNHIDGQYSSDTFYHIGKPTTFQTCG